MIDLAAYVLILCEQFSTVPRFPGELWRGVHRWEDLVFNSERSFHTYPGLSIAGSPTLDLQPFQVDEGILSITPEPIPDDSRAAVEAVLRAAGTPDDAVGKVTHYTGMLSLHDSWAETYGYVEIRARVPASTGYWPAFWLAPGTKGWPPEIDVFEIDSRNRNGPPVTSFEATVHFDGIGPDGRPLLAPRTENPYQTARDFLGRETPQMPAERAGPRGPRWALGATVESSATVGGGDLSASFHVWGVEWTPTEIIWWFGPSATELKEVFRTPTPPDLHSPLYVIANVEVGGLFAGRIEPGGPNLDSLEIDYIKVYARHPETKIAGNGQIYGTQRSDWLVGGAGDDVFRPGGGFDVITTGSGNDAIYLTRADGNAVIEGFGQQDRLVLQNYKRSPSELHASALQVGDDLWLRDPGNPFLPRTLILRGVAKADFSPEQIVRPADP